MNTWKRILTTISLLAMPGLLAAEPAAESKVQLDRINDHAKKVQIEAQTIAADLKGKKPDLDAVKERVNTLLTHVEAVRAEVRAYEETHGAGLDAGKKALLAKLKEKAELLHIYSAWKQKALDAEDASKNVSLLRAHAKSVAIRAKMMQETTARLAGWIDL